MDNRRVNDRVRTAIDCTWGPTADTPRNGHITSLSLRGCFIQTKAGTTEGQLVYVNCWLPSERWLSLRGRIGYHLPRVGFGLLFSELSEEQAGMLSLLIDYYRRSPA